MEQTKSYGMGASARETVLIVDDEPGVRQLLSRRLSREGYLCEEARGAEQAMEVLSTNPVALVLLDIRMPDKSGTELLPEIKVAYPDVAIIMATAVSDLSVGVQCLKQGADDYFCKPFNMDEVSLSVQRALERRDMRLKLKEYQNSLERKVEEQTHEIRKLSLGAIESLVYALEAKDRYTGGHSRRVSKIALALGSELGLSEDHMEDLKWGSLLHDIGKIAVDPSVHNKPGTLTQDEYEHIMTHAHVGAGIVQPVVNDRVVKMIEHHHDHFDGGGLFQVVAGDDIPISARILAVADAFDAMTSDRPYRSAMSNKEAIDEIQRCAGVQFDPDVVAAMIRISLDQAAAGQSPGLPRAQVDRISCADS